MTSATSTQGIKYSAISASTGAFYLKGGRYGFAAVASWGGGSVELDILGPDGTTWLATAVAFSADGYKTIDVPPGQYRITVDTATGIYISLTNVP